MAETKAKNARRTRRHYTIRGRISGTREHPRLVVFRSLKNIYAQVIDDFSKRTLAAAGSDSKELKDLAKMSKTEVAAAVGKLVGEKALAAGVGRVSFDRAGYKYHGRVKALAEAARQAGLKF